MTWWLWILLAVFAVLLLKDYKRLEEMERKALEDRDPDQHH